MRPVVSYDDITPSVPVPEPTIAAPVQLGPQLPSTAPQPPTKKRKKSHNSQHNQKGPQPHQHNHSQRRTLYASHVQHWDEPDADNAGYGEDASMYDENAAGGEGYEEGEDYAEEEEEEEEESRELVHEEIWDDSALIDAWNSATAEYEAYHGKSKKWKEEPVKKSPLWYNVPPSPSKSKKKNQKSTSKPTANSSSSHQASGEADNSTPLNFDTFVPTHDPTLASAQNASGSAPPHPPSFPGPDYAQYYLPNPLGPMVGQDEAFQRALSSMYWGGYWTAVYHYQRHAAQQGDVDEAPEAPEVEEGEEGEEDNGGEEDFVPTQR